MVRQTKLREAISITTRAPYEMIQWLKRFASSASRRWSRVFRSESDRTESQTRLQKPDFESQSAHPPGSGPSGHENITLFLRRCLWSLFAERADGCLYSVLDTPSHKYRNGAAICIQRKNGSTPASGAARITLLELAVFAKYYFRNAEFAEPWRRIVSWLTF